MQTRIAARDAARRCGTALGASLPPLWPTCADQPVALQGAKRTLQYEDIFDIPGALRTSNVYPGFQAHFDSQVKALKEGGSKVCTAF